jgi:L-2-hydroxyglutarate oxidase
LSVPSTGIVSYRAVCRKLVDLVRAAEGELQLRGHVTAIRPAGDVLLVETAEGAVAETRFLVNCAGLHSDRVARLGGLNPRVRIVPFRGDYYELAEARRSLVRSLIYPVPNPAFPFLGVHFTRMIDGSVHAGPNAVLSLKREGYHRTSVNLRDTWETLSFPGFWKLAAQNWAEGWKEMHRSFSKAAFVRSLQALVPEIQAEDLVPGKAGVRAQALRPDGGLVDDFLIERGPRALHVLNAPSPAATASLEIGKMIAAEISGGS